MRSTHIAEGWFEAPVSATYLFLLRTDVTSTLSWSGNETAAPTTILAEVGGANLSPSVLFLSQSSQTSPQANTTADSPTRDPLYMLEPPASVRAEG